LQNPKTTAVIVDGNPQCIASILAGINLWEYLYLLNKYVLGVESVYEHHFFKGNCKILWFGSLKVFVDIIQLVVSEYHK